MGFTTLKSLGDIRRVGVIGRQGNPNIQDSLIAVIDYFSSRDRHVLVEQNTAQLIDPNKLDVVSSEVLKTTDLLVVVGGDGSILGIAREFAESGIPVLGVNRGGLGFLADIPPNVIKEGLSAVINGDYRCERHFLLHMQTYRSGVLVSESPALNDVVVNSGSLSKMMDFQLFIDDEFVYELRADGLIISSPTGSTAYSLSAGGPIMHPSLDAIAIMPMFPHTLTARPIVVRGSSQIRVVLNHEAIQPQVSADSQVEFDLQPSDEVVIRKYGYALNLIHPTTHSFYEACRSKLDWGTRLTQRQD